jgi:hypothetical protein
LKAALRKAAARTFEDLIKAIAHTLADFKQHECANYIAIQDVATHRENALVVALYNHPNVTLRARKRNGSR